MRTDEFISMLASGETAVEGNALQRRLVTALGWGAFGSTFLMAIFLGVRSDLAEAAWLPMFWVKLAFPGAMIAGALLATIRLSRPGVRLGRVAMGIMAPVLAIWVLSVIVLVAAAPGEQEALLFGDTWWECLVNVTVLSVPAFAALFWAMAGLAPTRLALAGAAGGLVSGGIGAFIYALHCSEMAAPFLGIWYFLGMMIPAGVGAVLGPRLLRW